MANLKDMSTSDLYAEIERRKAQALEAQEASDAKYFKDLRKLLERYPELLDGLVQHGRTSCNDQGINNGRMDDDVNPRCTRCALISIMLGDYTECAARLVIHFENPNWTKAR